jgi:hypothetical protein
MNFVPIFGDRPPTVPRPAEAAWVSAAAASPSPPPTAPRLNPPRTPALLRPPDAPPRRKPPAMPPAETPPTIDGLVLVPGVKLTQYPGPNCSMNRHTATLAGQKKPQASAGNEASSFRKRSRSKFHCAWELMTCGAVRETILLQEPASSGQVPLRIRTSRIRSGQCRKPGQKWRTVGSHRSRDTSPRAERLVRAVGRVRHCRSSVGKRTSVPGSLTAPAWVLWLRAGWDWEDDMRAPSRRLPRPVAPCRIRR